MLFAVLATGPSMGPEVVEAVKGRCNVIAVSDAYKLAPWADFLVSTDYKWWAKNRDAAEAFSCRAYSGMVDYQNIEGVEKAPMESATNSGLLALKTAVRLGARKVILLGIDLHSPGDHFFGRHPEGLRSTSAHRMEQFKQQFAAYQPKGVDIVNCSSGSALDTYRRGDLACELS